MKNWKSRIAALATFALLATGTYVIFTLPEPANATLTMGGTGRSWVNVTNYGTFQQAIDATPTGGHLYIPTGRYTSTTRPRVVQMTITRQIHIEGDGAWHESDPAAGGSIIEWNQDNDLIFINGGSSVSGGTADGSTIEGLFLIGSNTASGNGRGMVARNVHHLTLRNVQFYQFSKVAFEDSLATSQATVTAIFDRCSFQRTRTGNLVNLGTDAGYATNCVFRESHFINNSGVSLYLANASGTNIRDCTFENDVDQTSATGKDGAYILWEGGNGLNITGCWFERVTAKDPPNNWMIYLNGARRQCVIEGNFFTRANASVHSLRAIKLEDTGGGTGPQMVRISNNLATLIPDTTYGHDDVVIPPQSWVTMENNKLTSGIRTDRRWWVNGDGVGTPISDYGHLVRLNEHGRFRLQGFSRDSIETWTDVDNGDMAFTSTDALFLARQGSRWRRMVPFVLTGPGPPQSGRWAIGDFAYSTTNDSLFIRQTDGSGIAASDWKGVQF